MNPTTTPRPWSAPGAVVDPRVVMSLRNLELRARVVVEGFWTGLHRSPYHGFSVEFTEYRQYAPGDDLRYMDWRVLARSDRYFIKRFEDETNLRCHFLVDQSRSMTYGSLGYSKAAYAATAAAALAYFLSQQGDAIGLMTFDEAVRDYLPARHRPGYLRRLLLALERPAGGRSTDVIAPLRRFGQIVHKRGLMVLFSDLFAPLPGLESALGQLNAGGHEILVFQILDPAEVALEFRRPMLFEDMESGRTLLVDPERVRKEYQRKLEEHCDAVAAMCRGFGNDYFRLTTDQPLEFALHDLLRARAYRPRRVKRADHRTGGVAGAVSFRSPLP